MDGFFMYSSRGRRGATSNGSFVSQQYVTRGCQYGYGDDSSTQLPTMQSSMGRFLRNFGDSSLDLPTAERPIIRRSIFSDDSSSRLQPFFSSYPKPAPAVLKPPVTRPTYYYSDDDDSSKQVVKPSETRPSYQYSDDDDDDDDSSKYSDDDDDSKRVPAVQPSTAQPPNFNFNVALRPEDKQARFPPPYNNQVGGGGYNPQVQGGNRVDNGKINMGPKYNGGNLNVGGGIAKGGNAVVGGKGRKKEDDGKERKKVDTQGLGLELGGKMWLRPK